MVFKQTVFIDKESLKKMYIDEDMTTYQIAKILGCSNVTIGERLKKFGIISRTQSQANKLRMKNNQVWKERVSKGLHFKGESTNNKGYKLIYSPEHPMATKTKYVLEHRLIAEKMLGRYLTSKEEVHHLDSNPRNNEQDNLHVFENKAKHTEYHFMLRGLVKQALAGGI